MSLPWRWRLRVHLAAIVALAVSLSGVTIWLATEVV